MKLVMNGYLKAPKLIIERPRGLFKGCLCYLRVTKGIPKLFRVIRGLSRYYSNYPGVT
jgi:hypothetical protein